MLKLLKPELMKHDPTHFPTFRHDRSDWVEYSTSNSMPFGMPFEKYDDKAERKPNGRMVSVFQVTDQDVIGLFSLLAMVKEKNLWKTCLAKRYSRCK